MTRKGITEHAERAYELLTERQKEYLKSVCEYGFTPILEYTGPENQIVLYYEKPKLTWLALRNTMTGDYDNTTVSYKRLFDSPYEYDYKDVESMVKTTRGAKDIEGVVVVWEDGTRVKIKADEYVEKHRVATGPFMEIHYLHLIFDNLIDDILPLKHGEFKERLIKYVNEVNEVINKYAQAVIHMVAGAAEIDQKTFATVYLNNLSHTFRNMCFELRSKGGDARSIVIKHLKRLYRTQHDLEDQREYIGAKLDL